MLIKRDLDSLLTVGSDFREFDGSRIVILGGTGFIGSWIVKALHEYALYFGYKIDITVITRNSKRAHEILINQLELNVNLIEYDFSTGPKCLDLADYFINGATPSRLKTGLQNVDEVYSSCVNATHSIIQSAVKNHNMPKVVNLSSGIVYGPQKLSDRNKKEMPTLLKPDSQNSYLRAKLVSETLLSEATCDGIIESISPRLFAFLGPGLELDEHFAIGNFLRDGLQGNKILISGNPETIRSYMYPTDLTIWILTALLNPKNIYVNIGSEIPFSMLELAKTISKLTSKKGVTILDENQSMSNYIPSTSQFRSNYAVTEEIALEEGLNRWIEWLSSIGKIT